MAPPQIRAARRLAGGEEGLTVVEVVVAGMILVVGSLGVFGLVDASTRNAYRAEQSQTVSNVLQRELEGIRELPYEEVGLSTLPAHESGDNTPNSRVSGTAFYVNRDETGLRSLVFEGSVATGPEPFEVEDVTGEIYRYVVWDACPSSSWSCVDGDYLKRAIVVAKLDATAPGGADRRYQEIQSQIVDPEAAPSESPGLTPGGLEVTAWSLWLTDSTCDREAPQTAAEREAVGDHAAHNTRGVCADGLKNGNAPGAPDLLWDAAVDIEPGEEEAPVGETPVFDYATDLEPEVEPDQDKGLQVKMGSECGAMPALEARTEPDPEPEPETPATMWQQLHKWITPPVESEDLVLTGEGTFKLWTQSIENGVYPATICVWLFLREGSEDTALPQGPEESPYVEYGAATWPSAGWQAVTVTLDFSSPGGAAETPVPEGARVGVALSVAYDEDGSGIQTLYDAPTFDTKVDLNTTGTLPEWP